MGQSKHQLEEARQSRVDKARAKTRVKQRATFVDMRADKVVRNAVGLFLERQEQFAPTVQNTIADTRMSITLKYSDAEACWKLSVSDVDAQYPNITYYVFRHADVVKVLAHAGYVLTEQWRGVLPRETVVESDLMW